MRAWSQEQLEGIGNDAPELPEPQATDIAQKMHDFTGLSPEYLRRCRFRVPQDRFRKELLRSRGQTVAAHDTRVIGQDPDANVRYDLLKTWQHGID